MEIELPVLLALNAYSRNDYIRPRNLPQGSVCFHRGHLPLSICAGMVAFKRCFVAQTAGFGQGRGELAGSVMNRMPSKGYGTVVFGGDLVLMLRK